MAGLHQIKPAANSRPRGRRVGRGNAARRGNFSGRGIKGQKARGSVSPLFEGGQLPLVKRLPRMRGFRNPNRVQYHPVNLDSLEAFRKGSAVTPLKLQEAHLVSGNRTPIKILGDGKLTKKLSVSAHAFSVAAKAAIEAAGGSCETLPLKLERGQLW